MSGTPITKVNYFDGLFLTAEDFNTDQTYHSSRQTRHIGKLHTWGFVSGLEIKIDANRNKLRVTPGYAIDPEGFEILVEQEMDVPDLEIPKIAATYYLTVKGQETDVSGSQQAFEPRNNTRKQISNNFSLTKEREQKVLILAEIAVKDGAPPTVSLVTTPNSPDAVRRRADGSPIVNQLSFISDEFVGEEPPDCYICRSRTDEALLIVGRTSSSEADSKRTVKVTNHLVVGGSLQVSVNGAKGAALANIDGALMVTGETRLGTLTVTDTARLSSVTYNGSLKIGDAVLCQPGRISFPDTVDNSSILNNSDSMVVRVDTVDPNSNALYILGRQQGNRRRRVVIADDQDVTGWLNVGGKVTATTGLEVTGRLSVDNNGVTVTGSLSVNNKVVANETGLVVHGKFAVGNTVIVDDDGMRVGCRFDVMGSMTANQDGVTVARTFNVNNTLSANVNGLKVFTTLSVSDKTWLGDANSDDVARATQILNNIVQADNTLQVSGNTMSDNARLIIKGDVLIIGRIFVIPDLNNPSVVALGVGAKTADNSQWQSSGCSIFGSPNLDLIARNGIFNMPHNR